MAPFEIVFNSVIAAVVLFALVVVVNNALWSPERVEVEDPPTVPIRTARSHRRSR